MLKRVVVGGAELSPIESDLDKSLHYNGDPGEVATFARIMRSFLDLDPAQRPRASEALVLGMFHHNRRLHTYCAQVGKICLGHNCTFLNLPE